MGWSNEWNRFGCSSFAEGVRRRGAGSSAGGLYRISCCASSAEARWLAEGVVSPIDGSSRGSVRVGAANCWPSCRASSEVRGPDTFSGSPKWWVLRSGGRASDGRTSPSLPSSVRHCPAGVAGAAGVFSVAEGSMIRSTSPAASASCGESQRPEPLFSAIRRVNSSGVRPERAA